MPYEHDDSSCRCSTDCRCGVKSNVRPSAPFQGRVHIGCPLVGGRRFTFRRSGARSRPEVETGDHAAGACRGAPCGSSRKGSGRPMPLLPRIA